MAGILDTLSAGLFRGPVDVNEDNIRWQNGLVAKLHANLALPLLIVSTAIFAKVEVFGDHIRCIRYSQDSQVNEDAFNSYCYITDTFSLPGAKGPHPGIGPHRDDLEPVYHAYYQWIPYLLLIQSVSFYLPYMLNKFAHDNRITSLIQNLQNVIPFNENRMDKMGDIHLYTQDFYGSHGGWAAKLVFSDFLNLVNIFFNILGVNWYLQGSFLSYGPNFLMYFWGDKEEWGPSPFATIFPKMTKCTLELFGPSGTVVNHDGLCILPINVLNERIFLILWFVFFPLLIVTLIDQILWFFVIVNREYRNRLLLKWVQDVPHKSNRDARRHLRKTLNRIGFGDWLLLYMIARNIDSALFTALASYIHPPGAGYYPDEEENPDEENLNN